MAAAKEASEAVDREEMLHHLAEISPDTAEALLLLRFSLGAASTQTAQDVYLQFGLQSIVDRAQAYFGISVGKWEARRTVLAFMPVLWTWLAIGIASLLFQQRLSDPGLLDRTPATPASLVAEWQRGFGIEVAGTTPFTFSNAAFLSVVLIAAVIALTLRIRLAENRARSDYANFCDAYASYLRDAAAKLGAQHEATEWAKLQRLYTVLGNGPVLLSHAVTALAKTLEKENETIVLTTQIRQTELNRLQQFSKELVEGTRRLAATAGSIESAAGKLTAASSTITQILANLRAALNAYALAISQSTAQLKLTAGGLESSTKEVNTSVAAINKFVEQSTELAKGFRTNSAKTEEFIKLANERVDKFGAREDALVSLLGHTMPELRQALENNLLVLSELDEARKDLSAEVADRLAVVLRTEAHPSAEEWRQAIDAFRVLAQHVEASKNDTAQLRGQADQLVSKLDEARPDLFGEAADRLATALRTEVHPTAEEWERATAALRVLTQHVELLKNDTRQLRQQADRLTVRSTTSEPRGGSGAAGQPQGNVDSSVGNARPAYATDHADTSAPAPTTSKGGQTAAEAVRGEAVGRAPALLGRLARGINRVVRRKG